MRADHNLIDRKFKDNKNEIVVILKDWLNKEKIDVIITTGELVLLVDITPEALMIADKHIPGFEKCFDT